MQEGDNCDDVKMLDHCRWRLSWPHEQMLQLSEHLGMLDVNLLPQAGRS